MGRGMDFRGRGCSVAFLGLAAALLGALLGCASMGKIPPIQVCGTFKGVQLCADLGRRGAELPVAGGLEAADPGRLWCTTAHGQVRVWPSAADLVFVDGEAAVPCDSERPIVEAATVRGSGFFLRSGDLIVPAQGQPGGPVNLSARPWIGDVAASPDQFVSLWHARFGPPNVVGNIRDNSGGPVTSHSSDYEAALAHLCRVKDPLLETAGAWDCIPTREEVYDAYMSYRGVEVLRRSWTLNRGEDPPHPPAATCPAGQQCRPAPVPCPPPVACNSCPDVLPCPPGVCESAEDIGAAIAASTASHRAEMARLYRELLATCRAPAPECPSVVVPVAAIADATSERMRLHTDALLAELGRLRSALAALEAVCKAPPKPPGPGEPPAGGGVVRFEASSAALTFRERLSGPGTASQVILRGAFTPSRALVGAERAQILWLTAGTHRGQSLLTLVATRTKLRGWQNWGGPQTSDEANFRLLAGVTYQILATYDTVAGRLGVGISGGGKAVGLEVEAVRSPLVYDLLEVMGSSGVPDDLRWPAGSKWEVALELRP